MSSDTGRSAVLVAATRVGKCYHIYERPQDRLKQAMFRWRRQFFREFWALRDVSFEVRPGEALGIIGRNGSGKSTLLQIIAGTLQPTEGEVRVRGRVAALLELGSGFNPDFTGRENVFMNGAILGLPHAEIEARFDEIAAFADIGEFVDQPVSTYSTGMVVRLAFAVQVLLQPDVLIVDEALAVGDAAFQIKCMTRMKRLLASGVAVILVTHDVNAVRSFCERVVWLERGRVAAVGAPLEVTSRYLQFLFGDQEHSAASAAPRPEPPGAHVAAAAGEAVPGGAAAVSGPVVARPLRALDGRTDLVRWGSGEVVVEGVALDNGAVGGPLVFEHGDRLHVEIAIRARQDVASPDIGIGFAFRNTQGLDIITCTTWDVGERLPPLRAHQTVRAGFDVDNILAPGDYALVLNVEEVRGVERHYFDFVENALVFKVAARHRIFSTVLPAIRHEIRVGTGE